MDQHVPHRIELFKQLTGAIEGALHALRIAGANGASANSINRMIAAHLNLRDADELASVPDWRLVHAIGFVESFRRLTMNEVESGRLVIPNYGTRSTMRVEKWKSDGQEPPAPNLQALLSILAEEGHDVDAARQELAPRLVLPVRNKPLGRALEIIPTSNVAH